MNYPKAVLFDLDGTLIDRHASLAATGRAMHRRFASRLEKVESQSLVDIILAVEAAHMTLMGALRAIYDRVPWDPLPTFDEFRAFYDQEYGGCSVPAYGMKETLSALRDRGIRTGLITNGGVVVQTSKIEALGLPSQMGSICISAACECAKPDPRIFRRALSEIGVGPHESWFVGDNPECDVVGAHSAGMTAVWMRGCMAWPDDLPEPDAMIDSLLEIDGLLSASAQRTTPEPG